MVKDRVYLSFFSTITFKNGELDENIYKDLHHYLNKKCLAYFLVQEYGSTGENEHYHLYLNMKRATRTDVVTRSIKTFYKDKSYANRYTIKTIKEMDPIYRIGCYMIKEPNHKRVLIYNVNVENYKELFNRRAELARKTLVKKTRHRLNDLPQAYIDYADSNSLDRFKFVENFSLMLRDGHLTVTQIRHLKYVVIYLKVLFGGLFEDYLILDEVINSQDA